jgi:phospholipid-binding lipoprotein MlaA
MAIMNAIKNIASKAALLSAIVFFSLLFGCATNPNAHPSDPWESWNRGVSEFNDNVDEAIAKPVATLYKEVTPNLVQTGINNFFSNLTDPWTAVNSALQLKPQAAVESMFRFIANTMFGLGGVFDVADEMNIDKHKADFGQTLGHWGVAPGPYLVLPLLGPSTLRDTVASTLIARGDPVWQAKKVVVRNGLYALRMVDKRANLLRATAVLDAVAIDKYSFTRDIFLQVRRNEIYDGNAPEELINDADQSEAKHDAKPEQRPELKSDNAPTLPAPSKAETAVEVK